MCVLAFRPCVSPTLWQKNRSRRSAQMRGSSWRMLPAVTLRVLANGGSPSFCLLGLVQQHQVGVGHVDFAADFQQRRNVISPLLLGEGQGLRVSPCLCRVCRQPSP